MPDIERSLHTVGAAAVVGASTFVPLPLVDDWIASLSRRQLVAATLRRHGRTFRVKDVKPLYDEGGSLLGLPWRLAKGVLLAPINKVLKKVVFVFAARDLALAVGKTVALGHILERELKHGAFRDDERPQERKDRAERLKRALDGALKNVDMQLLQRATNEVARRARGKAAETEAIEGFLAEIERKVDQALAGIR